MTEQYIPSQEAQYDAIRGAVESAFNDHVEKINRDSISLNPYILVPPGSFDEIKEGYDKHVASWADKGLDVGQLIISAMKVDTATEENLPWYTAKITKTFEAMDEWNHRWTTEEASHSDIMTRVMEARGMIDMAKEWHPLKEKNLAAGIHVDIPNVADGLAYVTVQELLTKIAHFNSSRLLDQKGRSNLIKVGSDEGRHYFFYIKCFKALTEAYPDVALAAMRSQHEGNNFAMPGQQGISGYVRLARWMMVGGVFDALTVLEAQKQTIREAGLLNVSPNSDQGKLDQEWAASVADENDPIWRDASLEIENTRQRAFRLTKPGKLKPFILNHTVELTDDNEYRAIPI